MTTFDPPEATEGSYGAVLVGAVEPELRAAAGVVDVRHYEASPQLQALRGANHAAAFAPGCSRFVQLVLVDGAAIEAPPPPPGAAVRHRERFALDWAMARRGCALSEPARPFAVHEGVQLAFGEVTDEAMRPVIAEWYRDIHAPDALEVAGFAVALRCVSADTPGRHLVVFLLDSDPAESIAAIQRAVPRWREQGRTPSPGGASRALFNGPFARLTAGR